MLLYQSPSARSRQQLRGAPLRRKREWLSHVGPSVPLKIILALAGILYCFRIAVILEKGIVGYGRMLEPLAQAGELGATAAALLLPDRLTLHIVEFVGRLM